MDKKTQPSTKRGSTSTKRGSKPLAHTAWGMYWELQREGDAHRVAQGKHPIMVIEHIGIGFLVAVVVTITILLIK